jgi:glyoxylase-like metal-dependent hydrolase (beta-lactamase superfamily II)
MREEFLLEGFPVSSPRGFLGWANALLLEDEAVRVAIDTGGPGDRGVLLKRMETIGLDPASVAILVLTHLHFDHCANADLFPRARIVLGRAEHAYVAGGAFRTAGDTGIFEPVLGILREREVQLVDDKAALTPGVRVLSTPGHTPGSLSVLYERSGVTTLACADLVKHGREFLEGPASPQARDTLARVRRLATRWIPGHDRPFIVKGDAIHYEGVRELQLSLALDPGEAPTVARWRFQ